MFKAKTVLPIIVAILPATKGKTHPNRFALVIHVELHLCLHLFINRSKKLIKFISQTVLYRGNVIEHAEISYHNQFKEKTRQKNHSVHLQNMLTFYQPSNLSRPSVPDEGYTSNPSCTLSQVTFLCCEKANKYLSDRCIPGIILSLLIVLKC